MKIAPLSRRSIVWLGLFLTFLYSLWIGGPYLRSLIVRDAAVSTWVHVATSPIDGRVVDTPFLPGDRIGADGRILTVENPRAETSTLSRARADLDTAQARVASLTPIVESLQALSDTRGRIAAEYAALFKSNLDTRIAGMDRYVTAIRERLRLERADADRLRALAPDTVAPSAAEAAAARAASADAELTDVQTGLDRARLHRRQADAGLFFLDDGSDGQAAQRDAEDARIRLARARADLAAARQEAAAAQQIVDDARRLYDERHTAPVTAAAGALLLSLSASPGATVQAGAPLGTWVECNTLFVDVPVSDTALSLLHPGAPATIVLEGERRSRAGTVLLMRGAAATLGPSDLAAIAKGRRAGLGQVLVRLAPSAADVAACPIGRAAFVYFPDVNVLTIARARLRW